MKYVTLCSGGMDSVTLAYWLASSGHTQTLLHIQYGQKQARERTYAALCAKNLECDFKVITLEGAFGNDALTSKDIEVPVGAYAPDNLAVTVVPNRNAIFACLAASVAIALNYDGIALAVHSGDHDLYPDCRPVFIESLRSFLMWSTGKELKVLAPFINADKVTIVARGESIGVSFQNTWSCYRGGELHCGVCSTCMERKQAFKNAWVVDPTVYEKQVLKRENLEDFTKRWQGPTQVFQKIYGGRRGEDLAHEDLEDILGDW